ncbi:hypothetical protein [Spirosoma daeguense]
MNQRIDKVFASVVAFIKQHGYLPGIPSAGEVLKAGGVDLVKMNASLLENIEELTLCSLQHGTSTAARRSTRTAIQKEIAEITALVK